MNKKLVSEKNPQGVEYPEAVTADGKLVSAIDIEKGSDAWEGVKFYFPGCEAQKWRHQILSAQTRIYW